jgi:hypothetical protein
MPIVDGYAAGARARHRSSRTGEPSERAEEVGDGVPALREDEGGEQDDEATEGRLGEGGRERVEQRPCLGW